MITIVRMAIPMALALVAWTSAPAMSLPAAVDSNVNLRAGPGTHFPSQGVIPGGTIVEVLACGPQWCEVAFRRHRGYVREINLDMDGGGGFIRPRGPVFVRPAPGPMFDDPYFDDGPILAPRRRFIEPLPPRLGAPGDLRGPRRERDLLPPPRSRDNRAAQPKRQPEPRKDAPKDSAPKDSAPKDAPKDSAPKDAPKDAAPQGGNAPAGGAGNAPAGGQGNAPAGGGNAPAGGQGNAPAGGQGNAPAGGQGNAPAGGGAPSGGAAGGSGGGAQ